MEISLKKDEIVKYRPNNSIRKGYWAIYAEIVQEIVSNRWLIFQLIKRDFSASYKQSMMGFVWAFVVPLISIGTFMVLNHSGIFNIGKTNVPYPLFVVLGMSLWQLFSTGLLAGSQSLVLAGQMISKINFSRKSLVISSVGQSLIAFVVQMLLFAVLCVCYRIVPHVEILLLPLILIPLLLMTLGFGFILSILSGIMKDVTALLPMCMTFLMFLTPVLYPKPMQGVLMSVGQYNPMYYFISTARELAFEGQVSHMQGLIASSIFAVVVFIVCIKIFHLTETKITERV